MPRSRGKCSGKFGGAEFEKWPLTMIAPNSGIKNNQATRKMKQLFFFLIICVMLTACRTSGNATADNGATGKTSTTISTTGKNAAGSAEAKKYATSVAKVKVNKQCIAASAKAKIKYGSSDLSVSAQLRMKRDDVVRLSLRFLGMEVGVLEFTPQDVLVVDRMNKRYVRAAYSEVSFLKAAELDFFSLQSLFWDELFVPGERNAENAASRFVLSQDGGNPVLTLADTPRLTYSFTTAASEPVVQQLLVKGQKSNDKGQFTWTYANFEEFAGRLFPTDMKMSVTGAGKDVCLDLKLSGLKNDSDWNTRTTVSSKYTRMSVDEIFKGLKF